MYLGFIDYKKAFNTVVQEILSHEMEKLGFPTHIIMLIKKLYELQQAAVRTAYELSELLIIGQGVRKGSTLSLDLLNIYAKSIMTETLEKFE